MRNPMFAPGLCLLLSLAGLSVHAQESTPASRPQATKPAKAPEVAPAPAEGKQVDVSAPAVPPSANGAGVNGADTNDIPRDGVLPKDRRAPYIIGPEDALMIKVWQEPNLSGPVTVGPDGMISLQLIDEVKADGLTPDQLKKKLTNRLKAFIVNPDVNVQVLRVNSRKFILQGEVNRPGSFPLTGPTTVMEALVSGGGFREFANQKKIYILRTEIDPTTKKPETKKYMFNYKDVSHGKKMEQNILVLNGDQIFVP